MGQQEIWGGILEKTGEKLKEVEEWSKRIWEKRAGVGWEGWKDRQSDMGGGYRSFSRGETLNGG